MAVNSPSVASIDVEERRSTSEPGGRGQFVSEVSGFEWQYWVVPAIWTLGSIPSAAAGYAAIGIGVITGVLLPRLLPALLLSSCFFYSTMSIPADFMYSLRAYWLAAYLTWMLVLTRNALTVQISRWVLIVGLLLAWGVVVSAGSLGHSPTERTPALEAAIAFLWSLGLIVGWLWLRSQDGRLSKGDLIAITAAWLVGLGYGAAQAIFGISEQTVPPDIWPQLQGFAQYEDLGRRPFASLTSNGMAAVSLWPLAVLLVRSRNSLTATALVLLLGVAVGVLSLTRSYLVLFALLVAVLPWACRTRWWIWLFAMITGISVGAWVLSQIDPELLGLALRLEGDVTSLRADLWHFTLSKLDAQTLLTGMGYGSGVWEKFLAPLSGLKLLASPHSALLEVTGTFGLAGLVAYIAIGLALLRVFFDQRRMATDAAGIALAGLLILLREQIATSYVFSPSILGVYFWVVFGMALGARDAADDRPARAGG
jgi:hypothetical protein